MLTSQEKLDGTLAAIRSYVPGFNISLKSNSKFQKFISKVLSKLGNKTYMDLYWTTIRKTVYRPSVCDSGVLDNEWRVILHEGRHADDCYKLGFPLYSLLYLFPQILGLLGILYTLAVLPVVLLGGPTALLWGLLSLLFLTPLPALPRAVIEARGYMVSMAVDFWCGSIVDEERYINELTDRFVNGSYYYMWPSRGYVKGCFKEKLKDLKTNYLDLDSYLIMCRSKCSAYK